jgi:AraC-like DNA-binding protein
MEVSDLLRDLIAELFRNTYPPSVQKQMSRLVLSLLHGTAPTADPLLLPTDPMLRSAAEGILRESRWAVPLETLCDEVHLTPKTFERKFLKDTGMTFKAWKSAARLCSALDCLAKGMSIKQTALHLGFSGPGPFSAAFTKFFGLTPGSLVQSLGKQKDR